MRTYKLLGSLEVADDGVLASVMKSDKGCALLALAILSGQTLRREAVADLLWDAGSTKLSLANLRGLLPRLRKLLPELAITRQTIAFAPADDAQIDVNQLTIALANDDLEQLDLGLRLYRGELLEGFYLVDTPRFNEWLTVQRERLRVQVLDGYRRVCRFYESARRWDAGIDAARRWLAIDDFDEDAHRTLMRLLAANGQITAAMQQYAACREHLTRELGIEPEAETRKLARELQASFSAEISPTLAPNELPPNSYMPHHRNRDFVGRQAHLQGVADLLLPHSKAAENMCAVAVTGIGGLGKTQFAVEFAFQFGHHFVGGVYWMSFAETDSVTEEVAKVGGALGMKLFQDVEALSLADKIGRIKTAWQQPIPRLLIFDNCEDEALLAKWLPVSGGCRVLLTSRRAGWARELNVATWPLLPLSQSESVDLVCQLAGSVDKSTVGDIASAVGYLPLALHLAGSFLARYKRISAESYLQQLLNASLRHPSLQGRGATFSPTGHDLNLARTFALSLDQLDKHDEIDQMALRLLLHGAQFASGEPIRRTVLLATVLDNSEDVMADLVAEDGLARLLELGFLTPESEQTVSIHRLIVAFVRLELADLDTAACTVAETIVGLLNHVLNHQPDLFYSPVNPVHLRHLIDITHARNPNIACQLSVLLGVHLRSILDYSSAITFLSKQVDTFRRQENVMPASLAPLLIELSNNAVEKGDFLLSIRWANEALKTIQTAEDTLLAAHIHENLMLSHARLDHHEQAAQHAPILLAALDHERTMQPATRAEFYQNLGTYYAMCGEVHQSLSYKRQALDVFLAAYGEDSLRVVKLLNDMGAVEAMVGNFENALPYLKRGLAVSSRLFGSADHPSMIHMLGNLGVTEWRIGDLDEAKRYFEHALAIAEQSYAPDHPLVANSLNNVAEVLCKQEAFAAAAALHQRAYDIRRHVYGEPHVITLRSQSMIGEVLLRQEKYAAAREVLEDALAAQRAVETNLQALSDTILLLGETELCLAQMESAFALFNEALQLRRKAFGDDNSETAAAMVQLGHWYQHSGDAVTARRYYESAQDVYRRTVKSSHLGLLAVQRYLDCSSQQYLRQKEEE